MPSYMDTYNAAIGDTTTRSRLFVSVAKYARFVVGGGGSPSADRLAWATDAFNDTRGAVDRLIWAVVGDPAYLSAGEQITDDALQGALEAAVNAIFP